MGDGSDVAQIFFDEWNATTLSPWGYIRNPSIFVVVVGLGPAVFVWPCPRIGNMFPRDQDGPDHRQRPVVTLLPLKYGSGGETLKPKVIVVGGGRMQVVPKRTTAVSLSAARALGMLWYPILKFLGRINELK